MTLPRTIWLAFAVLAVLMLIGSIGSMAGRL